MADAGGVWRNWGRNQRCTPVAVDHPAGDDELAEVVKRAASAGQTVKVVGSGHSFTDIACTSGRLVHLDRHDRVLDVDGDAGTVTVQAGITLARLNEELAVVGLALPNLGDIGYQTVAGATSTATHGTGVRLGNLSTQIRKFDLVLADGSMLHCSADDDPETYLAGRVGLGALGIVSSVTLQCVPAFRLYEQRAPRNIDDVLSDLDVTVDSSDHYEFFWFPHTDICETKTLMRTDDPIRVKSAYKRWRDDILLTNYMFGAACMLGRARPSLIPRIMKFVGGSIGKVRLVDRSDRVLTSPRLVRFVEMEYAIPRARGAEALLAIREMIERERLLVNFPVEVRFVAADDSFLSPANGRETCYIAVHMFKGMEFERYFRGVEAIMDSHDGRPHWGKMHFQTAATLARRYADWDRFAAVRRRLDPEGLFANAYTDRVLGPVA